MTRRTPALAALLFTAALGASACSSGTADSDPTPPEASGGSLGSTESAPTTPEEGTGGDLDVEITVVADGLSRPWDAVRAPDGTVLFTEREGRFTVVPPGGEPTAVDADLNDLFVGSETGLMALALDTDFDSTRTVYSCQGFEDGDVRDVRVVAWTAAPDWSSLERDRTVVDGFPITNGRHGGCRILPQPDGTLFIGTGDSAQPSVPQDPDSLGGKVLRVDAATGEPAAGNPDANSPVYTLGHRNVQGLAARPGTDQIYSVEQGSDRDDEVNLLQAGGNYGWSPDRSGSGYDESVAMTDPERVPGAIGAVWSSGASTLATASGTFLTGEAWGEWNGALAVGVQKEQQVLLLALSEDGTEITNQTTIPALSEYGRIRSVTAQSDGSMLVTTDNGDSDQVLLVTP